MSALLITLFWVCTFLVCYTYVLYPLVLLTAYTAAQLRRDLRYLLLGRKNRRVPSPSGDSLPSISIIVPAYNEEKWLPAKMENLASLDYPANKLEAVIVSDGSTDRTEEILRAACIPNTRMVFLPQRRGKANALNHAIWEATGDIVVFSDASTLMAPDAPRRLVRHFADPRIGAVCGSLQFRGSAESEQTEGVYWKYECALRMMEARLGATLTASGAIYAIRTERFVPLPTNTVIDDFVIPMDVRKQGLQVLYDPEAVATEFAADTIKGEFTRRVRLAIGSFRALPTLLRTPMSGYTRLAFFSHKLLRWILPFILILLAITNLALLGHAFFRFAVLAQATFYIWAFFGMLFNARLRNIRFALVGYFLLAMNAAFLVGFFRSLGKKEQATWVRIN